jgi:exosortase family protein XrtF
LKKYLILYKPFLLFLGKFLLSYLLLTFVYESYLSQFDVKKLEIDGITQLVAIQTKDSMVFFHYDADVKPNLTELGIKFFYNQRFIARIIEGCNGVNVIILFVSFVIAFSGKIKATLLYIIGGSLLIYILNLIRIALLCVLMYHFPKQQHFLHGVFFPLFIYGVVFMLWLIWIRKFSLYAKTAIKS